MMLYNIFNDMGCRCGYVDGSVDLCIAYKLNENENAIYVWNGWIIILKTSR